jgi:hypothetical protein
MQVVLAVCFVSVTCMKVSFVWRTVYWYWITREIAVWVHLWFIMIFPPDLSFPIRVLLWSLLMCFQICMYLTFISSCMLWPGICLFSLANALVGQTGCTSEPKQSFSSSVLWLRKCIDAGPHTVRWMLEGTLEMHVSRSIGQCSKICLTPAAVDAASFLVHSAMHLNLTRKAISHLFYYFSIRLDKEQADVCWEQTQTMSNMHAAV